METTVKNPAGFWVRLGAGLLDGLTMTIVVGLLALLFYGEFDTTKAGWLDVLNMAYYVLLPVFWYGYTLGKRALKIRIARVDGRKIGIGTMLMRHVVGGLVYVITIGIALIVSIFMVALREDKRAVHDFIAGTYVTNDPPSLPEEAEVVETQDPKGQEETGDGHSEEKESDSEEK